MLGERKTLVLLEDVANMYFHKTKDKWWGELSKTIKDKRIGEKWWRK